MSASTPLVFKIASEDWEFEAIHHLNYKTFVEEIPQHQPSPTQRLVDKFHAENTYLICLKGRKLVGMLAARGHRPFSLDSKVDKLDSFLPLGKKPCEIRLLAIEKHFRSGQVLQGLLALLWQYSIEQGYDFGVISGTTRQIKLYRHLGFVPFGPLVGSDGVQFQPMMITIETFEQAARDFLRASPGRSFQTTQANFLPGPVAIHRLVKRAFEQPPESHRGDAFMADFQTVKNLLCQLTGAGRVEILLGSGTLANDVVAAQLSLETRPGVILVNGEFGVRLVDHATRFGLKFETVSSPWGEAFDLAAVDSALRAPHSAIKWLWCAHCETSTGVLNDLEALKALCAAHSVKLCVDAISSLGTTPVDLRGVHFASGSSGKGLASYPGLGLVFHSHEVSPSSQLPRYLDLGHYAKNEGVAFTHSSNLVHALHAALKRARWPEHFREVAELMDWLRARLRELGFDMIDVPGRMSPAVVTLRLPAELDSTQVGARLQETGYLVSCNSEYLRAKNWIQVCLMGECSRDKVISLANALNRVCFKPHKQESKPAAPAAVK